MRGGEPQPAAEGAGGTGPPSWGCGGLCRRLVLWFPLPPPRSLGVRGGGPGAWPAGGAGTRKARQPPPEPEATTPADQAGRLWLGLRETVGRGRAGCGRERGHCVPHPPTLRGVMAQAHFPRGLLGRSALAPRSLRDVEDGTSLPFYSCCPQTRVRAFCKPSLPFGGTRGGGRSVGCIFYLLSPAREVRVDCSVALSALLSGFRVAFSLLFPQ